MPVTEHPNLRAIRHARMQREMAERMFDAAIAKAMAEKAGEEYTAMQVAYAGDISRARVYQIVSAEAARG